MEFKALYQDYKEETLSGRYITNNHIEPLLNKLASDFKITTAGLSVNKQPIYTIEVGTGDQKIYMWSQMHGNESTTTKALFDFINLLNSNSSLAKALKETFRFMIIPIANPDGATAYTRVNANAVDLNRDSVNLSQPESRLLRHIYDNFQPDYCFNLHDQRTIFGAGNTGKPATVSFLAPAYNENRDINTVREKAIGIIVAINEELQKYIPGQVGRFDDSFNNNCIGDCFQSLGTPTILFEAGHYPNDYEREVTREYIFIAYLVAMLTISKSEHVSNKTVEYFEIPQNMIVFFDFIYKNIKIDAADNQKITNFAAQYKETLENDKINFEAYIAEIGTLSEYFGHTVYDFKEETILNEKGFVPVINDKADFLVGNKQKIVNGLLKK
ncbi:M14 family metallopeptidase [Flavobacterium cerinum]|uniref:M14 family metallopeptidase n=1 Tax=Flavobacterium cerinum TaxID=2502784 RepID=A0ABY5IQG9_9FLAO|nr:M14 metallopeptidase family protein [Flavobacterium cerinum]UUC44525.1 M14 family metallopeptidase [Flavobacterium cerinum]